MDPTRDIRTADLSLGEEARDLWEPALPHLAEALAGDEALFLDALESAARGSGLTQNVPMTGLLDAYSRGSIAVREKLLQGADGAESACRLAALDSIALNRASPAGTRAG